MPGISPRFVTSESRERRQMYLASAVRDDAKHGYADPNGDFLATLGMRMRISRAGPDDLLLMSCRVVSRGVGTVLLNHVMRLARGAGAGLRAEFVPTGRNRMMYLTFMMAGFREVTEADGATVLESAWSTSSYRRPISLSKPGDGRTRAQQVTSAVPNLAHATEPDSSR